MSLNSKQVTGNGEEQTLITNNSNTESVVTLIIANNTTVGSITETFKLDGKKVLTVTTTAQTVDNTDARINIPASSVFTVTTTVGCDFTVSSYSQPVDVSAALTAIQGYVVDASNNADRAENALSTGAIDDTSDADDRAWSSSKLRAYTEKKWNYTEIQRDGDYLASDRDVVLCDNNTTAQVDRVENITVVNSTAYTVTINGVEHTYTSDESASSVEVVAGIVSAINSGSEPVTASDNTSYVSVAADSAGVPFTVSINANMSVRNTTANSSVFQVTLPASPSEYDSVIIKDVTGSFFFNNMYVVSNGETIMGVADDMNLDVDNYEYKFLFINNNWSV
jgi:hypothetical protein